jgi:hypothetical protein
MPAAVVDRRRRVRPEILVDPLGWDQRDIGDGQLDDFLVFAAKVARLLEIAGREDSQPQIVEAAADGERPGAGGDGLVELSQQRMEVRRHRADTAPLLLVVQAVGKRFRFAQSLERAANLTELHEHEPQALSGSSSSAARACSSQSRASASAERSAALTPASRR